MVTMMSIFEPHPKYSLYHLPPWASCLNTAGLLVSTLASVQSDGCFSKVNQIPSPSYSHPSEAHTMANMLAKARLQYRAISHSADATGSLPSPTLASLPILESAKPIQQGPCSGSSFCASASLLQVLALIPPSLTSPGSLLRLPSGEHSLTVPSQEAPRLSNPRSALGSCTCA